MSFLQAGMAIGLIVCAVYLGYTLYVDIKKKIIEKRNKGDPSDKSK